MTGHGGRHSLSVLTTLAWRNLWRHRRRTLITLSSIAIGFGLSVLIIGLNDGGHNSMIRNAIRLGEGHITVQPRGYLEAPANHKYLADGRSLAATLASVGVAGTIEPRISLQVLASTANNATGAGLEGLSSEGDERADMLRPRLVAGSWIDPGDDLGLLIGDGMARKLKAAVGGRVVLMAGQQGGDSQAQLGRVRGIFDSGVDELDEFLIVSDIEFARQFLEGEGADPVKEPVTRFAVFLDDPDTMAQWKAALASAVDDDRAVVLDWREMMPQLVQFIAVDDAGSYVFLILVLVLVVFGILNTVLMSVLERTRELGLLRALGLGRNQLLMLVFAETLLLSVLAVVVGWTVGGGAHLWFSTRGLDLSALISGGTAMMGTFMDPVIYTELSWYRVAQLTGLVFAATLASGIYPAIKAARVTPVQALRT
jgi:ABC-type lipoprotein release transport system permease subunit